jgi:hypothetical protein
VAWHPEDKNAKGRLPEKIEKHKHLIITGCPAAKKTRIAFKQKQAGLAAVPVCRLTACSNFDVVFSSQRLPEIQQLVRSLSVENDALREVRYLIQIRCHL